VVRGRNHSEALRAADAGRSLGAVTIRVLIADDHPIVRTGLAALSREKSLSPDAEAALRHVMMLAQRTLTDGRQAVWGLRMSPLGGRDLVAELQRLGEDTLRPADVQCTYEVTGTPRPLAEGADVAAARIMQESLANIVTHAQAREVRVRVGFEVQDFVLTIIDDGVGFTVDADFHAFGGHWGLIGMRERASEAGGSLRIRSAPGAGTEIALQLPYGPGES
jgi:signal transduction histidine kinase